MLVNESLDRFALLNEDFLAENILNEKLNINTITDYSKKLAVLASMFVMFTSGHSPQLVNSLPDKNIIAKNPIMINMAKENFLDRDEIFMGFEEMMNFYKKGTEKEENPRILSAGTEGFIEAINSVKPGRLDTAKIAYYDQYDADILRAVDKLKAKGENPNADLIKSIMIIETGMNPSKNSLGFEGFPQTKPYILNGWTDDTGKFHNGINQKYGTSFTIEDMYDPEKSAEFIHYYLKGVETSQWVDNIEDLIIAYNWGLGNLRDYKKGEKELPQQTADYVAMVNVMQDYFTS